MTERILAMKNGFHADDINAAVWSAFRNKQTTWIDDEHSHIAAIVPADKVNSRILTMYQADWLGQLIRAVQACAKMRYYVFGASGNADSVRYTLRAFTLDGGGLYPNHADIRDAYVWASGFMEHWFKVDDLIKALDNAVNGSDGLDAPMAMIDWE